MGTLHQVTPPAGEIITLEEAKSYLRVDSSHDDDLIEEIITAARVFVEGPDGRLNVLFAEQTWMLQLDTFPSEGEIMIPLHPVQSIVSINYYDEDGNFQQVSSPDYYLDGHNRPPWILTTGEFDWPAVLAAANSVEITFIGGFAAGNESESGANNISTNVPKQVKLAMKMLVQHWYDNRGLIAQGTFDDLPFGIKRILQPFRMFV